MNDLYKLLLILWIAPVLILMVLSSRRDDDDTTEQPPHPHRSPDHSPHRSHEEWTGATHRPRHAEFHDADDPVMQRRLR